MQYNDMQLLQMQQLRTIESQLTMDTEADNSQDDSDDEEEAPVSDLDEAKQVDAGASASSSPLASPSRRRSSTMKEVPPTNEELGEVLVQLQAAEWHVLHRESSLGRNALQATLNQRRSSIEKTISLESLQRKVLRTSVSSVSGGAAPPIARTDPSGAVDRVKAGDSSGEDSTASRCEEDASRVQPERDDADKAAQQRSVIRKKTVKVAKNPSLSSVLQAELGGQINTRSRANQLSTGDLIARVAQGEKKRRAVSAPPASFSCVSGLLTCDCVHTARPTRHERNR